MDGGQVIVQVLCLKLGGRDSSGFSGANGVYVTASDSFDGLLTDWCSLCSSCDDARIAAGRGHVPRGRPAAALRRATSSSRKGAEVDAQTLVVPTHLYCAHCLRVLGVCQGQGPPRDEHTERSPPSLSSPSPPPPSPPARPPPRCHPCRRRRHGHPCHLRGPRRPRLRFPPPPLPLSPLLLPPPSPPPPSQPPPPSPPPPLPRHRHPYLRCHSAADRRFGATVVGALARPHAVRTASGAIHRRACRRCHRASAPSLPPPERAATCEPAHHRRRSLVPLPPSEREPPDAKHRCRAPAG